MPYRSITGEKTVKVNQPYLQPRTAKNRNLYLDGGGGSGGGLHRAPNLNL
jgi:hypothetical protein